MWKSAFPDDSFSSEKMLLAIIYCFFLIASSSGCGERKTESAASKEKVESNSGTTNQEMISEINKELMVM